MTTTTMNADEREQGDVWCVDQLIEIVASYVGERPVVETLPLLAAALSHVLGIIERESPGAAAILMPGIVNGIFKAVHIIATDGADETFPSKRSH